MGNHGSYSDSGRMSMAAYSLDLRKRVMRAWDGGMDAESVAAKYEVSRAWCIGWYNGGARPGAIAPRAQTKFRARVLAGQEARLAALIAARPDATLAELRAALSTSVGLSTLWREIDRLGSTVKKTVHADEQRRPDVVAAVADRESLRDGAQFVFLHECGVATDLLWRYGRSPCGTRLRDHAPFGHWDTHTVVATLRLEGLGAPAVFNGPIDNPSFLAYIEQILVPTLRQGDIVVLDNLAVHKQAGGPHGDRSRGCDHRNAQWARSSVFCRRTARTSIRLRARLRQTEGLPPGRAPANLRSGL